MSPEQALSPSPPPLPTPAAPSPVTAAQVPTGPHLSNEASCRFPWTATRQHSLLLTAWPLQPSPVGSPCWPGPGEHGATSTAGWKVTLGHAPLPRPEITLEPGSWGSHPLPHTQPFPLLLSSTTQLRVSVSPSTLPAHGTGVRMQGRPRFLLCS